MLEAFHDIWLRQIQSRSIWTKRGGLNHIKQNERYDDNYS